MTVTGGPLSESEPLFLRQRPPNRYRIGRNLILVSQCLERMGYYGLIANFVFFLNGDPYAWTSYNAVSAIFLFNCASYMFAFVGAWLAEVFLGKFRVILIGYVIYLIFFLPLPFFYFDTWRLNETQTHILPVCAVRSHSHSANRPLYEENCVGWVMVCMTLVGVGAAFIKAVITPFGADQFPLTDPSTMRSFFNWYYWFINAGTFFAYMLIAFVQVNYTMFWGYMIPYMLLFVSFGLFAACRRFTRRNPASGKGLAPVRLVLRSAADRASCCGVARRRYAGLVTPQTPLRSEASRQETCVDADAEDLSCLDRCNERYGGNCPAKAVNMTRRLLKIMLIFTAFIFYWACYYQIESTFLSQGLHMKALAFSPESEASQVKTALLHIPATWLTITDILTILFLIPFLDSVVNPFLDRRRLLPPLYFRMALGMVFSMSAMIVAGFIERMRRHEFWGNTTSPFVPEGSMNQTIGQTVYFASANMSVLYQIPQYFLLGLGEAFTNVAGLEFAYTHAPRDLQSLITGLYWFYTGLGTLLGFGIVQLAHQGGLLYSSDYFDINYRKPCKYSNGTQKQPPETCAETRLDEYFFILAGVQLFGIILLVFIAWYVGLEAIGNTREAGPAFREQRERPPAATSTAGESVRRRTGPQSPAEVSIVNSSMLRDTAPAGRDIPRNASDSSQTQYRSSVP